MLGRYTRRERRSAAMFLGFIVFMFVLVGCALTSGCQNQPPISQVIQGRQAYTLVLSGLNSAHRLGFLPNESKQRIEPYRKAAADALDEMEREALAGGTNSVFSPFTAAAKSFGNAMLELARAQAEAAANRKAVEQHAASTRPVTP